MPRGKHPPMFDPDRAIGYKEDFAVRRDLAIQLRALRLELGLTQQEAAELATLSGATWSNLELMRWQKTTLEYIMAAFRGLGKRIVITIEDDPDHEPPVGIPEGEMDSRIRAARNALREMQDGPDLEAA